MADEYIEQTLDRIEGKLDQLLARGGDVPDDEPDGEPDAGPDAGPGARWPSQLIPALRNWTIMLPTGSEGDPDNDYVQDAAVPGAYFAQGTDVVFRCPADGVHSENSKYPRCEAREMADDDWTKAAWSSKGPRTLVATLAIDTSHLSTRKRIVGAQIHDGGDDVLQLVRDEQSRVGIAHNDGKSWVTLLPSYRGEFFDLRIGVIDNRVRIEAAGQAVELPKTGSSWYFKIGCYLQTGGASEHDEPAGAYGEVRVRRLAVTP